MKRFVPLLVAGLAACAAQPVGVSPGQALLNTTADTCKKITATITATDQAVLQGVLPKSAAEAALKGFTAAITGCNSALASIQAAQPAASGVSK